MSDLIRVPLIYWPQTVYVKKDDLDKALAEKRTMVPTYTRDGRRRALLANPKPGSTTVHVENISLPINDFSRETCEKNYLSASSKKCEMEISRIRCESAKQV